MHVKIRVHCIHSIYTFIIFIPFRQELFSFCYVFFHANRRMSSQTPDTVARYAEKLQRLGRDKLTTKKEVAAMRALQSERAGVTRWQTSHGKYRLNCGRKVSLCAYVCKVVVERPGKHWIPLVGGVWAIGQTPHWQR